MCAACYQNEVQGRGRESQGAADRARIHNYLSELAKRRDQQSTHGSARTRTRGRWTGEVNGRRPEGRMAARSGFKLGKMRAPRVRGAQAPRGWVVGVFFHQGLHDCHLLSIG